MVAEGKMEHEFLHSSQEATVNSISPPAVSEVDALLAELLDMGFPYDAAKAAINQTGTLNIYDILEFMLRSKGISEANDHLDAGNGRPDHVSEPQQKALLPIKQEVEEHFAAPKQLIAVKVEPESPSTSTSVINRDGRSRKKQVHGEGGTDSLERVAGEPQNLKSSKRISILQRLLEMGCRADVAEKAYEIYGQDPTYGSEDERLDVICDYIAAVNLNEEDDDPEAEDQERNSLQTSRDEDEAEIEEWLDSPSKIADSWTKGQAKTQRPLHSLTVKQEQNGGLEEWFASQSDVADSRTADQAKTKRPLHSFREKNTQEQNEVEYTPGGYYKYIHEDDPDLEELFQNDLEEQEGMALFAVKRKKLCESSTSVKNQGVHKRAQVPKAPVTRRIRVPHFTNMTGYGVPGSPIILRKLPHRDLEGPPYFYFENVAFMPGDEWDTISRHLFDIEPEFVNAYHFTVCKRPRGYVHNLPVEGRFEILPRAPRSIKELVPYSTRYWPTWDDRTTFSCICTSTATEGTIKPVMKLLGCMNTAQEPPSQIRRQIMDILRMYNMVWIGPGQLARPKVEELEVCMGFDRDHTRPILSTNQQIKGLGNAFQVHTVGYHLSVLKEVFPNGLNVLSLFSGIGGAEVALHKLGIKTNVAVCVEIDPKARRVIEHWWKVTNHTGRLITKYEDVNELDYETLQKLMAEIGGFDLVIGGSPCSNLSAKNRFTRMGLAGRASVAFYEYSRILKDVRTYGLQHRHQQFYA